MELQRVRDAGGEFVNALYVHRSVQRALPEDTTGDDLHDAVAAIMESALTPLFCIDALYQSLLTTFRHSAEYLARVDGLTSSDLRASLIQTLGLVHLLDGVKDNKVSIQRDFAFYESTLRKQRAVVVIDESNKGLEERLNRCRKLREIFNCRWWFMNGLLEVLVHVPKAARTMIDLLELLVLGLRSEENGSGPVFLPHDRYKLLRALPVAMYLYHFLSKKIVVTDPLPAKLMESCFKLLKRYPVVPGVGDYAVLLFVPILGIPFAPGGAYAKDMKRHTIRSLDETDRKVLEHLEAEYSMVHHHLKVLFQKEVHQNE